jgi:hypothetical protein
MTGLTLLPSSSRRGGTEGDGVVTWEFFTPTTPPAAAGTPPQAGGEFILLGALSRTQIRDAKDAKGNLQRQGAKDAKDAKEGESKRGDSLRLCDFQAIGYALDSVTHVEGIEVEQKTKPIVAGPEVADKLCRVNGQ